MIDLCGRRYGAGELAEYFGNGSCLAGFRRLALREGRSEGVRITQIRSGSGLELEVNETRGMDLGRLSFRGVPISYQGYGGECHPSYFEAFDDGWLRSYGGGLLVMGGLRSTGTPEVDCGEVLPLHGRVSNIPAEQVNVAECVDGAGVPVYEVSGSVRECKTLDHNLVLRRRVSVAQGSNAVRIDDEIANEGFEDQELMLLYHFNIGHPVVGPAARLLSHSALVTPRDKDAEEQPEPYDEYVAPTPHYKDIVYYHDIEPDDSGMASVAIVNEEVGLGVYLRYDRSQLPCFTQWKFLGQGNYVAGIEPGTSFVSGRSVERSAGRVEVLPARAKKRVSIEVGVLASQEEISAYCEKNGF